ncbi:nucleolar protein 12 [Anastrepha ludens]|uniref:nucleolar protein 12 n=1 Tax=Anastrepha ludens TaxID=28586 RepID=UPI0023B17846|nr:nucleolar protein 12 [Anastrepha ludens]
MRKKEIVFDPEKRKNFLSGFRKRKNERRARAKEELEQNIKKERKRIRNDLKNCMAHMKKTFQPLSLDPELEQKCLEKDYEDDEVKINVIELVTGNPQKNLDEDSDKDSCASEASDKESNINSIPGMDYNIGGAVKKKEIKNKSRQEDNSLSELGKVGNTKMLNKLKKKKALKEFKKSKVFKQKERIEKKKQQKSSRHGKKSFNRGFSSKGSSGNKRKSSQFKRGHSTSRGERK